MGEYIAYFSSYNGIAREYINTARNEGLIPRSTLRQEIIHLPSLNNFETKPFHPSSLSTSFSSAGFCSPKLSIHSLSRLPGIPVAVACPVQGNCSCDCNCRVYRGKEQLGGGRGR